MNNNLSLKQVGLKITGPRVSVLEIFMQTKGQHLSAEDVQQRLQQSGEDIGLATIYRVLLQFEQAGLLQRHHFEGERAVYELNHGEHHDHLVCLRCGRVQEFYDAAIEERQLAVAEQFNFQISDHALTLYGICAHCN